MHVRADRGNRAGAIDPKHQGKADVARRSFGMFANVYVQDRPNRIKRDQHFPRAGLRYWQAAQG